MTPGALSDARLLRDLNEQLGALQRDVAQQVGALTVLGFGVPSAVMRVRLLKLRARDQESLRLIPSPLP